jgi:hypothetical protein
MLKFCMLKFFDSDRTFLDMSKVEVLLDIFRQRQVATTTVFHNPRENTASVRK